MPPLTSSPPHFQFKPTRQPLLWAALAYSAGIAARMQRPNFLWIVAAISFLSAALYFRGRRPRLAGMLVLGAFFLGGSWHAQLHRPPAADASLRIFEGQQVDLTGHVIRAGKMRQSSPNETRQSLDFEIEEITAEDGTRISAHSGVRLGIYSPASQSIFHYGERMHVIASLRMPRNFRNPGAFDYQGYLASKGIAALASAKAADVQLLPGFVGSRLERFRSRAHSSIIAKIHELWPPPQAALLDAMLIGEEAFLERDTRADFQRSGTYHVLVVSGMNVTILAFVIFWMLRRFRFSELPATLITILFCVGYALLTEEGAPVWRATLMCAIYLCTRLLFRDRAMVNALSAAALGLLVFDPLQLFMASFQMTFLCVLIVAALAIPLTERTSQLYRQALSATMNEQYATALPPKVAQFRLDLRLVAGRLSRFLGEEWSFLLLRRCFWLAFAAFDLIVVSAVMQMGLALPMAYYFHRATSIGLPANMAVVPLMQALMPAALVAVGLGYVSPLLAKIPVILTSFALAGITGTIRLLGGFRLADLRVVTPSVPMITAAILALILALLCARRRAFFTCAGLAALLLASLALAFVAPRPMVQAGVLEVTSIDVGEGDSILLVMPQGKSLLVDAGGPTFGSGTQLDFGEDVVAPYLWNRGISHLDVVAISHGHSDHIGGMAAVLKDFHPRELWIGLLPPSRALEALVGEAQSLGIRVVRHWEGDEIVFGDAKIDVLFPPQDWPAGSEPKNNDSMVLQVSYGGTAALLEGDAEKAVERRVARLHHPRADLLKVGHHGSATSTTAELLQSVRPSFAIISVGWRNSFGLPKAEVLQRLQNSGTRVFRTDVDGASTFYLDGHSVAPHFAWFDP